MLKETFVRLLSVYSNDSRLAEELWTEIESNYSGKKRHYHTPLHLQSLLRQLLAVKDKIQDWNTLLFSLYYHDIIYNALRSDNEEKSAELAGKRMQQIGVPAGNIENCKIQILATKKHQDSSTPDTNYFTDADLSILGTDWETYHKYYQNVRKEYSVYPNIVYNPGRKKVLKHFLEMEKIFKTHYFFDKFERQARENISREIELL